MSSLLSKTFGQFACCAAVCFVLTAPLFYLLTKCYYAEEMMDILECVRQGKDIPPLDLEEDIITGMMIQFLLIFVAITLALFITLRLATRRLWQPFDDTLFKAERFQLTQGGLPHFEDKGISEFARLNRSLTRLMRKDQETYRIQKEFTENASHELQTPLAIMRGKLDLLMQENLDGKQMPIVADLYTLTTRMEHLNRNLLMLAKIENAQYATQEQVDIASLLSRSLPLYATLAEGLTLHTEDCRTTSRDTVQANPVLLECLFKNLIVNAIRHSAPRSTISITLHDGQLAVANPSADGQPLDGDTLFCRFRPGDGRQKGNGLGLAIVKAICDYHHWRVSYRYTEGRHLFTVDFHPSDT